MLWMYDGSSMFNPFSGSCSCFYGHFLDKAQHRILNNETSPICLWLCNSNMFFNWTPIRTLKQSGLTNYTYTLRELTYGFSIKFLCLLLLILLRWVDHFSLKQKHMETNEDNSHGGFEIRMGIIIIEESKNSKR